MQVDFYQLTRDPAEHVLPSIAGRILADGGRLLIVGEDGEQLARISKSLWEWKADSFLAHAKSGEADDSAQPILLAESVSTTNQAAMVALADGIWRDEALQFERAFYLFAPDRTEDARTAWRALANREDVERRYWKQDGGKWRQRP